MYAIRLVAAFLMVAAVVQVAGAQDHTADCGRVSAINSSASDSYVIRMDNGVIYQIKNLEILGDGNAAILDGTIASIDIIHKRSYLYNIQGYVRPVKTGVGGAIGVLLDALATQKVNEHLNLDTTIYCIKGRCLNGRPWSLGIEPDDPKPVHVRFVE